MNGRFSPLSATRNPAKGVFSPCDIYAKTRRTAHIRLHHAKTQGAAGFRLLIFTGVGEKAPFAGFCVNIKAL